MNQPETQYTKVDDSWIAYQVVGDGPVDLTFVSGIASNIETMWDWPEFAHALERMASYSRLIVFDPRGAGVSDATGWDSVPTWEDLTQDLRAVLTAAKSERTAILSVYDGSTAALLFAASHPDRTSALILWNGYARSMAADDYPIGQVAETFDEYQAMMGELWGRDLMIPIVDPSRSGDPEYVRAAARYLRTATSPGRALAMMRDTMLIDARPALPSIRVPTLVFHNQNAFIPVERGRYMADRIEGSRFVELPSSDLNFFALDSEFVLDEIEEFITGSRRAITIDRVLATILFTDIVGSTETASTLGDRRWREFLAQHDRIARDQVERFNGRLVNTMGDGMLATFDGPGRAIRCAHALGRALEPAGIKLRAGLHTGEVELREGDDIGGIAVHIASRVMSEAGPGEVTCSRTVKDLVAGSEFAFDDRGVCALKGVPDQWQLYAVRQA